MSGSDLLRRAAETLRQHAQLATVGPWVPAPDGLVWADPPGDPVSGSEQVADAELIALLGPPVALALADAMDEAAGNAQYGTAHGFPLTGLTKQLTTVARAILREPES